MAGELAMTKNEVHEAARDVLRFWFEETPAELRFARNDGFDAAIRARFGELLGRLKVSRAAGWEERPETLLAAVIVLDQFGRNLFRGDARAFEADPVARGLTRTAMRNRWDTGMTTDERAFLYLPLEHSEDAGDQADSVAAYAALGDAEYLKFARDHRDAIERFGRFPARNPALGRESTAEEKAWLDESTVSW